MKRYFKSNERYYEYDDQVNVRQAVLKNGHWHYASENYRREYLADQPLSESDSASEEDEISPEEFEQVWEEVMREQQLKRYFRREEGNVSYFEYDRGYAVRQVEITNGYWRRSAEDLRRQYLTKQPLAVMASDRRTRDIALEEFEAIWQEALQAEYNQALKRPPRK